ncbi:hypothetical protein, partial [Alienimonas chondri]|uniref:hypothetical protein n=1 Tax=Alienimonas chondri TaxID=2681879 RepID=UPI0014889268
MRRFAHATLFFSALLAIGAVGCGGNEPQPKPAPAAAPAPITTTEPKTGAPDPGSATGGNDVPPPPIERASSEEAGYAEHIRTELLAGDATVVRESLPPGAIAAVGALRRALVKADPEQRAAAVKAVGTLGRVIDGQRAFLLETEAVKQGDTPGVDLPGWVAPLLRAVAAGPASSEDPAALTDAALIDGTVAVLLEDPVFRRGLEQWTVQTDVPRSPVAAIESETESEVEEGEEETVGLVTLVNGAGEEASIPLVASGGAWVPAVVEATAPVWAAKSDSAGGTGAAAVLAAAGVHLEAAAAAETQEAFDAALRSATDAALAAAADPPRPVPDRERVTVEFTKPLTARQVADLVLLLEAATDDPARAVSRATPRSGGPGWRVIVGPVNDVAAWLAKAPALAGAAVEGRT